MKMQLDEEEGVIHFQGWLSWVIVGLAVYGFCNIIYQLGYYVM